MRIHQEPAVGRVVPLTVRHAWQERIGKQLGGQASSTAMDASRARTYKPFAMQQGTTSGGTTIYILRTYIAMERWQFDLDQYAPIWIGREGGVNGIA